MAVGAGTKGGEMYFREHRGELRESLATMVELKDRDALAAHCSVILGDLARPNLAREAPKVQPYFAQRDERTGWEKTYIVIIEGFGPIGFIDTMC
jgi:hypothetical protein